MFALLIVVGVFVILVIWAVAAFNGMVSLREQVRSAGRRSMSRSNAAMT